MRVVLDTNIFFRHWHFDGANFTYLFHYLNNQHTQLLLSEVVRREANNIQARELEAAISAIRSQLDQANHINGGPIMDKPLAVATTPYDVGSLLNKVVDDVVSIGYDSIPQSKVIERALRKKRPFQDNGAGYRDTIIWLSLLDYLAADKSAEPVAFVTNNRADFFNLKAKDETLFHPHLLEDLVTAQLNAKIRPFESLEAFVQSTIDKDAHALDHSKIESLIEEYLEEEAIRAIESRDPVILDPLNECLTPRSALVQRARSLTADVIEPIEDFSVLSTKDLGNNNIYIRVDFDLRIVGLYIEVALSDYRSLEPEISASHSFYEIQILDDAAMLKAIIRPRFEASVIYNKSTEDVSAFDISRFRVKQ